MVCWYGRISEKVSRKLVSDTTTGARQYLTPGVVLEQHKASSLHSVAGLWGTKSKDVESPQVELDMAKRRISID